jgi:hypothetical protein
MAKRMNMDEEFYRIPVEIEYDILYRRFNDKWDHTKPTTGDFEGDNPMYIQYDDNTHEHYAMCLGPYGTAKQAEKQYEKWEEHFIGSPDSYKNLKITRSPMQRAAWEEVK